MFILVAILCLLFGHGIWWALFGVECTINGGMRGGLDRPYIYMVEDFKRLTGMIPPEEGYPGWGHFIFMHIIVQFGPLICFLALNCEYR